MKIAIAWLTSLSLMMPFAHAQTKLLDDDDIRPSNSTSEYVYRSTSRGNLIPIQVMGSVGKPGLYFVPPNTNLIKVLTLAGGTQTTADNEDIIVKKSDGSWKDVNLGGVKREKNAYKVDLELMLKKSDHTKLPMSANDIVFVPPKEALISADMSRTISVVSLVMGIVLTGILIDQKTK